MTSVFIRIEPTKTISGPKTPTALARAMLNRPKLLLADEPTGNLDDANAQIVLASLSQYARQGAAVLLVTHDPKAAAFAPPTIRMAAGKIVSP